MVAPLLKITLEPVSKNSYILTDHAYPHEYDCCQTELQPIGRRARFPQIERHENNQQDRCIAEEFPNHVGC